MIFNSNSSNNHLQNKYQVVIRVINRVYTPFQSVKPFNDSFLMRKNANIDEMNYMQREKNRIQHLISTETVNNKQVGNKNLVTSLKVVHKRFTCAKECGKMQEM